MWLAICNKTPDTTHAAELPQLAVFAIQKLCLNAKRVRGVPSKDKAHAADAMLATMVNMTFNMRSELAVWLVSRQLVYLKSINWDRKMLSFTLWDHRCSLCVLWATAELFCGSAGSCSPPVCGLEWLRGRWWYGYVCGSFACTPAGDGERVHTQWQVCHLPSLFLSLSLYLPLSLPHNGSLFTSALISHPKHLVFPCVGDNQLTAFIPVLLGKKHNCIVEMIETGFTSSVRLETAETSKLTSLTVSLFHVSLISLNADYHDWKHFELLLSHGTSLADVPFGKVWSLLSWGVVFQQVLFSISSLFLGGCSHRSHPLQRLWDILVGNRWM